MHLRRVFIPLLFVSLLTGCGVLATFIPPIEIGDVLGVDGQILTVTFEEPGSGLARQVMGASTVVVEQNFDDQELDLRGFTVRDFVTVVGFEPLVRLRAPLGGSYPDDFVLTRASASATLSDAVNGSATMTLERDLGLLFERDEGSCDLQSCGYLYSGDPAFLAEALTLIASESAGGAATLQRFVDIMRLDGAASPNQGRFTFVLEVDSDPGLDGFEATFRLKSGGTTIKLGG